MTEWGKWSVQGAETYRCYKCGCYIAIRIVNGKAAKPTAAGWKKIRGYWYCKECKVTV